MLLHGDDATKLPRFRVNKFTLTLDIDNYIVVVLREIRTHALSS